MNRILLSQQENLESLNFFWQIKIIWSLIWWVKAGHSLILPKLHKVTLLGIKSELTFMSNCYRVQWINCNISVNRKLVSLAAYPRLFNFLHLSLIISVLDIFIKTCSLSIIWKINFGFIFFSTILISFYL